MSARVRPLARAFSLALALPLGAQALPYFQWTSVTLPEASGARCGNGSPARVMVNLAPASRRTLVFFEGGGACWTQKGCLGQGKLTEVASNPQGVPTDYFNHINMGLFGLATPLITRTPVMGKAFTQSWNLVYVPYCTGDVHAGHRLQVYADADPSAPLTYHHRGHANTQALADWLKAQWPRPEQLLVAGSSAGGLGATANYAFLREAMQPERSALMNDSGPILPAPLGGDTRQYPSLRQHTRVREAWGLDAPGGVVEALNRGFPVLAVGRDLATLNTGLPKAFPSDRFGFAAFQGDGIFPAFAYGSFYPELAGLPTAQRDAALQALWRQDLQQWRALLDTSPRVGYYIPTWRPLLKAHTLLTLDFSGTGIEEAGYASVLGFVEALVDEHRPLPKVVEQDQVSDHLRPVSPLQALGALLEGFFL